MLQQTDKDCSFTSALWLLTLMWNDFFLDVAANLKKIHIVLVEPVSSLLKRCTIQNTFHASSFRRFYIFKKFKEAAKFSRAK